MERSFNRTSMESKRGLTHQREYKSDTLLIEPVWNRNVLKFFYIIF